MALTGAMTRQRQRAAALLDMPTLVVAGTMTVQVLVSGCGGYTYTPSISAPSAPSPPSPKLLHVTIDATGVHPAVASGPRAVVEFVNQDARPHEIYTDPHPGHSECVELNLGTIPPGQTVSILTPFESGRACGYHDDTQPDDSRFQGMISIR